ncbi:MAG: hypothetical protein ACOY5F_04775 [Pseudomonadota bacterium]
MAGKRQHPEENWTAALEAIASSNVGDLDKIIPPGLPEMQTLRKRSKRDPIFAERLRAAIEARNRNPGYRPRTYSAEQYRQAIELVEAHPTRSLKKALSSDRPAHLPSRSALLYRAKRRAEFADQLGAITASRPKPKPKIIRTYRDGELQRHLRQNDLYRATMKAIPRFDPQAREDLQQELILAVLERRVTESELQQGFKSFSKKLQGNIHPLQFASLDAPHRGGEKETESLVDTLTADQFYEAA